jgi:hypothetical protein
MKHMKLTVIATLLLLGISVASAQSLGDYARAARKNKAEPSSTSRHYDNDNLPISQPLSVVGPPPAADADAAPEATDAKPKSSDKAAAANPAAADAADAEHQKAADWNKKIDEQQKKLDSLNHDLDLEQREYRLRVATQYDSEANRIQNAGQWAKEDEKHRNDTEAKQKAIADAQQELNDIQDQAHKAGIAEKEKDSNKDADNNQDSDKDNKK